VGVRVFTRKGKKHTTLHQTTRNRIQDDFTRSF
jgi:hypothetical protein